MNLAVFHHLNGRREVRSVGPAWPYPVMETNGASIGPIDTRPLKPIRLRKLQEPIS